MGSSIKKMGLFFGAVSFVVGFGLFLDFMGLVGFFESHLVFVFEEGFSLLLKIFESKFIGCLQVLFSINNAFSHIHQVSSDIALLNHGNE